MKTFNIIKEQLQYNRLMQPNTKKAEQNHTLKGQNLEQKRRKNPIKQIKILRADVLIFTRI